MRPLLLALPLLLTACSGGDGVNLGRPHLYAGRATAWPEAVDVEVIAQNPTEAPLWIRRLDIALSIAGADFAAGAWEGERQVDPGSSVLLGISVPLVEGAAQPAADSPGALALHCRYARSGVIGLLGGETHDYELPIVVRRGQTTPE